MKHCILPGWLLASLCLLSGVTGAQVITEFSAGITPGSEPYYITAGPDGNLWFTETNGGRIGRITPLGKVTEFSAGLAPGAHPVGITAGPDGNLWFTNPDFTRIGRITPLGTVTEFAAGTIGLVPYIITAGPDGNLWFTETNGDAIGRITTSGVVTEFSAGIAIGAFPRAITAGPDGNLWFTEEGTRQIARITPLGVITEFSADTTGALFSITGGPDGNLWFTENDRIGRITPLGVVTHFSDGITPGAEPFSITAGPDDNLWFTEPGISAVARITPLGVVTEFHAGITPGARPRVITAGPNGDLWFTEWNCCFSGERIGQITTRPPLWAHMSLEPCRIMDTRSATAGSGVQGPIAGNSLRMLPGFIATGQNWSQYGGNATSDCGLTSPPGDSIRAVALVATILSPNFDAYLGISDTNSLSTALSNVALNFTSGQGLSTVYIVPQIATNNIYFAMPAGLSAHVIFDVVGYQILAEATALQCTTQTSAPVAIGNGTSGTATSPACDAGFTLTSGSCDSTSANMNVSQTKATEGNTAWLCAVTNRGVAAATLTSTATCCGIPGK